MSLAVTMIIGPIVLKLYRVRVIFMGQGDGDSVKIEDIQLFLALFALCFVDLIAWRIYDPTRKEANLPRNLEKNPIWYVCGAESNKSWGILLFQLLWKLLLIGYGVNLICQTYDIDIQSVNDSPQLMKAFGTGTLYFVIYFMLREETKACESLHHAEYILYLHCIRDYVYVIFVVVTCDIQD